MFGWTLGFLVAELVLLAYWPDLFTQLAGTFNPYGFVVGSLCSAWLQFIVHWRVVFAEGRVWLIDLDAMKQHRSDTAFARVWRRDRARFLRNWAASSLLCRWLDTNLPADIELD